MLDILSDHLDRRRLVIGGWAIYALVYLGFARAAAFGWQALALGVGVLPASLLFGALWQQAGPAAAFGLGATLAGVSSLLLWGWVPLRRPPTTTPG